MPRPTGRRHRSVSALTAVLALGCLVGACTGRAESAEDETIKVLICANPNAPSQPWHRTLGRAIARALAKPEGAKVRIYGDAECGQAEVEVACTAGVYDVGPRMACAPETLIGLARAAAWYAVAHARKFEEDYESFRLRHPKRLGLEAFARSNRADPDEALEAQIDGLRQETESSDDSTSFSRTRLVFDAVLDLIFAALIGHESGHLETRPPYCALQAASRVEESGLWKVLLQLASSDRLYAPQNPIVDEIRADRCSTRRIRYAGTGLSAGQLIAGDQAFARRAAADIVATMLLVRFTPGSRAPHIGPNASYLYAPLRIVALAGEIGLSQDEPVICGGAAEVLVEAVQRAFKDSPGRGELPDEIERLLPQGVVDAWNSKAAWSPASFGCR